MKNRGLTAIEILAIVAIVGILAAILIPALVKDAEDVTGARPAKASIEIPRTKIIEIEGCEYVFVENSLRLADNYAFSITHKGNCKNPIHLYAKLPVEAP